MFVCTLQFQPHHQTELWCDVLEDPESHALDQLVGSVHLKVTWNPYSQEQIDANRGGHNETESKINQEQQVLQEQMKQEHNTAGDAPLQQGNITQHPTEQPREPGPSADLPAH